MMDISRYDINQQVRSEDDLVPSFIESLLKEISRISSVHNVQCDFKSWNIRCEENAWQITKSKKKLRDTDGVPESHQGVISEAAEDFHIKASEKIAVVLKDIKKKQEQEDR